MIEYKGSDGRVYSVQNSPRAYRRDGVWFACTTYSNGRLRKLHLIPYFTENSAYDFLKEYAHEHNIQLQEENHE